MPYLYLALALFLVGVVLLIASRRQQRLAGLPGGRVIYTDTRGWGPLEKPLYDSELGLTGKPDYLVEEGGKIIPVEVKTGRIPTEPHDAHIFQLAAYCLLVERSLGKRPDHGLLHYQDRAGGARTFTVDFTPALENNLLEVLESMRLDARRKEVHRSHSEPARCRRCGFRSVCTERLEAL